MALPWEQFDSGDTATATAPADEQGPWARFQPEEAAPAAEQGPWSKFGPSEASPVQAPDLSKIKLSPYDQATMDRGGVKPPSGMESGTELTGSIASDPIGFAKSIPAIVGGVMMAPGKLAYAGASDLVAGATGDTGYGGNLASMQRGEDQLPAEKMISSAAQSSPKLAVAANIAKSISEMAPMMGMAVLPATINRIAAGAFSLQMIAGVKSTATELGAELGKPVDEQDAGKIASLKSDLIQTGIFAPLAGAGAASGLIKPRGEMQGPPATGELLRMPEGSKPHPQQALLDDIIQEGVKRSDAEALISGTKTVKQVVDDNMDIVTPSRDFSRLAASPDSSFGHAEAMEEGYTMAIARLEKILGLDKVKKPEPPVVPPKAEAPAVAPVSEAAAKPEVATLGGAKSNNKIGDPMGTTYHATPEDWAKWQELLSKPLMEEGVWPARETMKNKYGGMPPEAPKAAAAPPAPPAAPIVPQRTLQPGVDVEQSSNESLQMRQPEPPERTVLSGLSQQTHAAMEALASAEKRSAQENELSKLLTRLFEARKAEETAVRSMRQPQQPNAPPGLQPAAQSGVDVRGVSPEKTPAIAAPTPAAPEMAMAGPGTPSAAQGPDVGRGFQNQSGADIYGIAQRVREQRAKAGQVAPIPTGQGVAASEAVKWGQDLISTGVNPEKTMQEFERTRAVSFDLMAVGRGHGESLAKTARSIEGKFGTDSDEYRMAHKALTDWDTRSKAMQTEWHKIGMAQQGETDIDTGSFTGISRAYKETTGQDFTPGQKQRATKIAATVSSADTAAQSAKPNLQAAVDKIGAPVEPHIQRLAQKIIAAMDKKANDALARIKARQAQGRAFSVGDPEEFDDLIIYGAAKLTKGVVEFGVWSHEMLTELGKGIEPHLRKIFDSATKYEDDETTRLAGGKINQQKIKAASKTTKVPANVADQKKAFQDYKPGAPLTPDQLKTLWTRATEYIKSDSNDMADVVYKVADDLGISARDVLKGLHQSRSVKRVADDVWQKQRQARILKQSARQWIEHAQETWMQKALPASARALFSAKVGLHGTVALGTHASLVAATHPIIFVQNFGKMHKLVASPEYYQMQGKALARRPNYNVAQRGGLVNDMAKMEDFNDPRLALQHPKLSAWFKKRLDKVHLGLLVGMGTRGYSVLKILRQDLFDQEWDKLSESKQTPDMAKAIADSVNHITGVDKAKLPAVANYALFAPKLLVSRVKVIAGDPLRAVNSLLKMRDMTDAEKWFAKNQFKEKAKIFGTATGLLIANQQLNNLLGDDKKLNGVPKFLGGGGIDPMSSDFMKFRVAGMNVAWGSPFLTMSRMPLRLIQIGMSNGGKSRFLIYPDESMYKTAGSYLRTQESPFMSPIVSLLTKADWQDRPLPQIPGYGPPPPVPKRLAKMGIKPYSWLEFGSEIFMPIPIEEGVKEIWHYGMGASPEQQAAIGKSFAVTILMAATGGRIQEDWDKPAAPATPVPPWESFAK